MLRITIWRCSIFYRSERRKTCLLYEHTVPEVDDEPVYEDNSQKVEAILEELITVLPINETKPITAAKFTSLVFAIRKLDVMALRNVWTQFYNCDEEADMLYTERQCKKSQYVMLQEMFVCLFVALVKCTNERQFPYLKGTSSCRVISWWNNAEYLTGRNIPSRTFLSARNFINK